MIELNNKPTLHIHGVSKRLLLAMKKNAVIEQDNISSGVFSTFELQCILNDHITEYRIRKCMKELEAYGLISKSKFFVDNESNLMCWKWHITKDGFNVC